MDSSIAWVYIMTNQSQSVLYTGFTTNLRKRALEHRTKRKSTAFTARYNAKRLVYYQGFLSVNEAKAAETYIKGKTREWKRALVTKHNPKWKDLRPELDPPKDPAHG